MVCYKDGGETGGLCLEKKREEQLSTFSLPALLVIFNLRVFSNFYENFLKLYDGL